MKEQSLYSVRSRREKRNTNGSSLAELGGALVLMVPILLIVFDCLAICIGTGINDATCRDAARAAASGPPGQNLIGTGRTVTVAQPPYKRAKAVVKNVYQSNLPMKIRDNMDVVETVKDIPPTTTGGSLSGEVSVETTIDIYPPFLVGAMVGESGVTLKSKHVVPYTYTITASSVIP